jgi:tetratricopeptide (TPR) repeat protein
MTRRIRLILALALALLVPPASGADAQDAPPPEASAAAPVEEPDEAEEPGEELTLLRIPPPDLAALEPSVAEQIQATFDALSARLAAENPPSRAELSEIFGEVGRLLHAYELVSSAEAAYVNAHRLDPEAFAWPHLLGRLLTAAGRADDGATWHRMALERIQSGEEALPTLLALAEYLRTADRLDEAEIALSQARQIAPGQPALRAEQGQLALARQDWRTAIQELEAALEAVPAATRLHHPLGLAYRGAGDLDAAREHLAQRGEVGLTAPDPWMASLEELRQGERVQILRGRMAFRAGDMAAAVEAFAAAVEAAPESVAARVNLGSALAGTGDVAGAIEQFRRVLELQPDNQASRFNLATLLAGSDDRASAEEAAGLLESLVAESPGDAAARRQLAEILVRLGRTDEALAAYREAVGIDPYDAAAWLGEVELHLSRSDYATARERLDNAFSLNPRSPRIVNAYARLLAGSPAAELRDGEQALDLAQQLLEAVSTVEHAATLAMALAEVGRCDDAATLQEQVVATAREGGVGAGDLAPMIAALSRYRSGAPCRPPVAGAASDAGP